MTEYRSKPLSKTNLSENHVYITPFRHLLSPEVFGSNDRHQPATRLVTLRWRQEHAETDVPAHTNGKPRTFFRDRTLIPRFLADSGAAIGDVVIFVQRGSVEFALHLERADGTRVT